MRHRGKLSLGFTIIEVLVGLLVSIIVITSGVVAVQSISKAYSNNIMRGRAQRAISDTVSSLIQKAGLSDKFTDPSFKGTYYYPPGYNADDTTIDPAKREAYQGEYTGSRIKVIATIADIDPYERTRAVTLKATWTVGIQSYSLDSTYSLFNPRESSIGGDAKGRVVNALNPSEGVQNIRIIAEGESGGGKHIFTRTNQDGEFLIKSVKVGNDTKLTFKGDSRSPLKPSFYFRGIDKIDTDLTDSNPAGSGGLDEWEVGNSATELEFTIKVEAGKATDLGTVEMTPFGSISGSVKDFDGKKSIDGNFIIEMVPLRREIATWADPSHSAWNYYPVAQNVILTNSDGTYTFDNVCPGNYRLYMHGVGIKNTTYQPDSSKGGYDKNYYNQLPWIRSQSPTDTWANWIYGNQEATDTGEDPHYYAAPAYDLDTTYFDSTVALNSSLPSYTNKGQYGDTKACPTGQACPFFRVMPGEMYSVDSSKEDWDGNPYNNTDSGGVHSGDYGKHIYNGVKTSIFYTVKMGGIRGKVKGAKWDGNKFDKDNSAVSGVQVVSRFISGYMYNLHDGDEIHAYYTEAYQSGYRNGVGNGGMGGFVRDGYYGMRSAVTDSAGVFTQHNVGPRIINSYYQQHLFDQATHFELFPIFPSDTFSNGSNGFAPVFVVDDPNSSLQFFYAYFGDYYTKPYGGRYKGASVFGDLRAYVTIPSKALFANYPNGWSSFWDQYPYWTDLSGVEKRSLFDPNYVTRDNADLKNVGTLKLLKKKDLANLTGRIVDTTVSPFPPDDRCQCGAEYYNEDLTADCSAGKGKRGLVTTFGIRTSPKTPPAPPYAILNVEYPTYVHTDGKFDFTEADPSGEYRILPSIPQWKNTLGYAETDPAFGNNRYVFYYCRGSTVEENKNAIYYLMAQEKNPDHSFKTLSYNFSPDPKIVAKGNVSSADTSWPANPRSDAGADTAKIEGANHKTNVYNTWTNKTTPPDKLNPIFLRPQEEKSAGDIIVAPSENREGIYLAIDLNDPNWEDASDRNGSSGGLGWWKSDSTIGTIGVPLYYNSGASRYEPPINSATTKPLFLLVYKKVHFGRISGHVYMKMADGTTVNAVGAGVGVYVTRDASDSRVTTTVGYQEVSASGASSTYLTAEGMYDFSSATKLRDPGGSIISIGDAERMFVGIPGWNIDVEVWMTGRKQMGYGIEGYDGVNIDQDFTFEWVDPTTTPPDEKETTF